MTLPLPLWTCGDTMSINNSDKCCTELAGPQAKTGHKGHGWMWVQLPTAFDWRRLKVWESVFASILPQKWCPLLSLSWNGLLQPHLSLFKAPRDCLITAWLILFRHIMPCQLKNGLKIVNTTVRLWSLSSALSQHELEKQCAFLSLRWIHLSWDSLYDYISCCFRRLLCRCAQSVLKLSVCESH